MNNIQHLLDTLGPPPAEVCLDWAWQLVSLADQSASPERASWSTVLIDLSGQLSLADPSKMRSEVQSISELVLQLLDWSGNSATGDGSFGLQHTGQVGSTKLSDWFEEPSTVSLSDHRRLLGQSVLEMQSVAHHGSDETSSAVKVDELAEEVTEVEDVDEAASDCTELLSSPQSISRLDAEPAVAADLTLRAQNRRNKHRTPSVLLWSGAALSLGLVTWLGIHLLPNGQSERVSTGSVGTAVPEQTADSTAIKKHTQQLPAGGSQSSDESVSPAELELTASSNGELTTLQSTQEQAPRLGVSAVDMNGLSAAIPGDSLSNLAQRTESLELPKSESVENAADATASLPDLPVASPLSADNNLPIEDVASMLAAAAKAEPKVNNVDADAGESATPKLPIQLLDTDSMLQVQEISPKIRVRQPVWQLRIASTEAFSVDPPGIQSLAEKETARWILNAQELKPRKDQSTTQVVVLAQLAGRRADIKWKIAAGCADLPAIAVPLNQERLDVMLNTLQVFQQRLTSGVASISGSLELPGISREHRAALTTQRKAMENEGKLVTRARQIIADAGMFASWLDRSIEMHGSLTDQVGGHSVTILQIGQPEPPNVKELPYSNEPMESGQSD